MSVTNLKAGDVILINTRTWYNIKGQKYLRDTSSVNTTHVALSLGDGVFIHADRKCGVDMVFLLDLIDKVDENWKVIRHIEVKDVIEEKIKKSGVFHLNKSYSYRFFLEEKEKSLFCSQFVDLVYKTIGIDIFSRKKEGGLINRDNALPVDFERLLFDDKRWSDVTKEYLDEINDGFVDLLKPHFELQRHLIVTSRNMRRDHFFALDLVHILNDSHNLLPDEHKNKELEINLSEMITDLDENESGFFYDFWDVKSKRLKEGN